MIKYIILPFLVLVSWTSLEAQEHSTIDMLNKASHQRMLTQKMLNCYQKIGMGIEVTAARAIMEESAATFEESMLELMEFAPNQEIVDIIEDVQAYWRVYSLKVLSFPNKIMGGVLLDKSSEIIEKYDKLLLLLEQQIEVDAARLVNLSGRLSMLSQRIQVLYLAQKWGLPQRKIDRASRTVQNDFNEILNTLLSAEVNRPSMLKNLNKIKQDWTFIQQKYNVASMSSAIIKTTDVMVQQLEETTKLYTELTVATNLNNDKDK